MRFIFHLAYYKVTVSALILEFSVFSERISENCMCPGYTGVESGNIL